MWFSNETIATNTHMFGFLLILSILVFTMGGMKLRELLKRKLRNGQSIAQRFIPKSIRYTLRNRMHFASILMISLILVVFLYLLFLEPLGKVRSVQLWEKQGETRLFVTFSKSRLSKHRITLYSVDLQGNNPKAIRYVVSGRSSRLYSQGTAVIMAHGENNACAYNPWTGAKGPCIDDSPILEGKEYRLIERGKKALLADGSKVPLKLDMGGSNDALRVQSLAEGVLCNVGPLHFERARDLHGFMRAVRFRNCNFSLSSGVPVQLMLHHKTVFGESPLLLSLLDQKRKALWTTTLKDESPLIQMKKDAKIGPTYRPRNSMRFTAIKSKDDELQIFGITKYSVMLWRLDTKSGELRDYRSFF